MLCGQQDGEGKTVSIAPTEQTPLLLDRPWSELGSDERIIEAANSVYNEVGSFPLPLSMVAEQAGVSRSLIYSHFPDQHSLMNRLIDQHVAIITPEIRQVLSREKQFRQACFALSELLFHHFVRHGRLLFRATQDEFMRQAPNPELARILRQTLVHLTRLAARQLELKPNDALFMILIMSAIPEETARLVSTGQTSLETGQATLARTLKLTLHTLEK